MKAKERETIREAIRLLMEDDPDFSRAVSMLCGLVGLSLPQHDLTQNVRLLPWNEFHDLPEGPFKAPEREP